MIDVKWAMEYINYHSIKQFEQGRMKNKEQTSLK
jgi:hypothetical protein